MNKPVRTAIVGCGKVGQAHAEALESLVLSEFLAVCDSCLEKAEHFAQKFGVRAYSNLEEMIRDLDIQMVNICTPHPYHVEQVVCCAQNSVHVLVEKPLSPDLASCDRAIEACNSAGVKLGVISQRRFYPPIQRMLQAIKAGKIGNPILATLIVMGWRDKTYYASDDWRGKWSSEGGGVLINQTPHQLDLLQWIMGPIEELFGYWDNLNHPYIEVEDTAVAVIRFKSGALGSVLVSNSQKPGFYGKIHIHGSNGASVGAQTEGGSPFIAGVSTSIEPPINDVWTIPGEEELLAAWQAEDHKTASQVNTMTYYHKLQIEDFLESIIENRAPLVDGNEGRKVVEIFTGIYRSQRDSHSVRFPLKAEKNRQDYDGRLR